MGKPRAKRARRGAAKAKPETPAKPLDAAAQPSAPPQELQNLGMPPDDPLASQTWMYQALVLSAYDVVRDPKISPRERRKELRTISASAAKLFPRARMHQAEQLIMSDRAELERKSRERRGAKLERRPSRVNEPGTHP